MTTLTPLGVGTRFRGARLTVVGVLPPVGTSVPRLTLATVLVPVTVAMIALD